MKPCREVDALLPSSTSSGKRPVRCGALVAVVCATGLLVLSAPARGQSTTGTFASSYSTGTFALNSGGITAGTTTLSGNVTFDLAMRVEYMLIGGGGGGGSMGGASNAAGGGGGGAGGFVIGSGFTASTANVVVGAGGAANQNGSNSSFLSGTAIGGGRGGQVFANAAGNGGSGGGAAGQNGSFSGGSGSQGNAGGSLGVSGPVTTFIAGAGGGGAGSAGQSRNSGLFVGGAGGSGTVSNFTGVTGTYAGGGGGGASSNGNSVSLGGSGGGGNGASTTVFATAGVANTGGGGGAGSRDRTTGTSGGSGLVAVRYAGNTVLATGGSTSTITVDGTTYTLHMFRATGTSAFTLNGAGAASLAATGTGAIAGTGKLVYAGSGTLTLAGNNSYSGGTEITGSGALRLSGANTSSGDTKLTTGQLTVANALALQNSTVDMATGDTGSLAFNQGSTLGGLKGSRDVNFGGFEQSLGNNNADTTYSGAISNGSLTKVGTGTFTLDGANSYASNTTIKAGVLKLGSSGAISSSGTVTVGDAGSSGAVLDLVGKGSSGFSFGAAQTLKGTGTVLGASSGTVTINGLLSPGNSPGLLTFQDTSVLLAGTSSVLMEITGSARGANPGYDAVDINNGGLIYGGTMRLLISQTFASGTFDLFKFSLNSVSGSFASIVFEQGSLYSGLWSLQSSGSWQSQATVSGGGTQTMSFQQSVTSGGVSYGQLVIVPEPTTLGLLGIGCSVAVLACRRARRGRRRAA